MPLRVSNSSQIRSSFSDNISISERPQIDFKKTLSDIQLTKSKQLEFFLTRLDDLGKKLVQSLSLKDLDEFRETVKSFLKSTFGQSSKLQEESYWDSYGRPKILARITKINHALEELGQQFINKNPKPLDVLAKIDQIRGLILDLLA